MEEQTAKMIYLYQWDGHGTRPRYTTRWSFSPQYSGAYGFEQALGGNGQESEVLGAGEALDAHGQIVPAMSNEEYLDSLFGE